MLDELVLLDHSNLVFVQKGIDIGALLDKAGSKVGAVVAFQVADNVEDHVEQNISI